MRSRRRFSCLLQGHADSRLLLDPRVVNQGEAYHHSSRLCTRSGLVDHPRRVTRLCSSVLTAGPMDIKVPTSFENPESAKGCSDLEQQPDRRHVPP